MVMDKVNNLILGVIGVAIMFIAGAALFPTLVSAGNSLNDSGMPLGSLIAGNSSVLALGFAAFLVIGGIGVFLAKRGK